MCRIAGIYNFSQGYIDYQTEISAMTDVQERGGPDGRGIYCDDTKKVWLGHRRLSIIDLSERGSQPMSFQHLTITFNGEVYNYQEIQQDLKNEGYGFDSNSDTEVVLKAFHCWGDEAVKRFRGMFALGLWNTQTRELKLITDRVSVKPIYFFQSNQTVFFSSELKGSLKSNLITKEINRDAISLYFRYGFIPAPYTIYKNIQKLNPATILTISKNGEINEKKYWDVNDTNEFAKISDSSLLNIIDEAIKLRMVADVPVGVFLSGGIDSIFTLSRLIKHGYSPQTFTMGFEDPKFNEAEIASSVAEYFGTQHHDFICTEKEALSAVGMINDVFDEPFGDPSAIPSLVLAQNVSKHVKVALSADGGDEAFFGYEAFEATLNRNNQSHLASVSILDKIALKLSPKYAAQKNYANIGRLERSAIPPFPLEEFKYNMSYYGPIEQQFLFNNENGTFELGIGKRELSTPQLMALWDYQYYVPGDIMTKVDRVTMHCGLEAREPLLDHKLIEACFHLPLDKKFNNGTRKLFLKEILKATLPDKLWDLPKKGFTPPLHQWFKASLKDELLNYLSPQKIKEQGIFSFNYIETLKNHWLKHNNVHPKKLYLLLIFQKYFFKNYLN